MKSKLLFILLSLQALLAGSLSAQSITVQLTETTAAQEWQVDVLLDNAATDNLTAFQLDMLLPNGLTLETESLLPGTRIAAHTLMAGPQTGNSYSILGLSPQNVAIAGTGGTLFSFTMHADNYLETGAYVMRLNNIYFARRDGTEVQLTSVTKPFKVDSTPTGIANLNAAGANAGRAYTIDGRRADANRKGVVIVGGKKVIRR